MKITFVVNSLGNSGGTERILSTKVNYLSGQLNYQVTLIVKESVPNDLFFSFSSKIKIVCFNFNKNKKCKFLVNARYKKVLFNFLSDSKQDFVVGLYGDELPFLYQLKDGSQKIQEFHYTKNYLVHLVNNSPNLKFKELRLLKARLKQKRDMYFSRQYDTLILLTQKDRDLWTRPSNAYVVPNALSFVSQKKSSLDNKKFLAVGRLTPQKGFDQLILAFSNISTEIDDWTLDVYGEGQQLSYLNTLIFQYKLQDKIRIIPPVKDIETIFAAASIFVFSSIYEGFGLVLTEAMECGLPIIAYDCECGPSEIITEHEDGFLVPVGDVELLSKKMLKLALDENLRMKFGENSQMNVKRFYIENIIYQWLTVVEKS